jgi:hypothetical protein
MKYRLDLQLLFLRHFPWPIPISVEIWYMVIFYFLGYTGCSLSVWTLVQSLAFITDTHALFYEYLHQLVKPHLLNIVICILNCHSCQFSHTLSLSTKVTLLIAVFVSLSVDQPRYKWNYIIIVSNTSTFNYFKYRLSSAAFSAPLWRWTKIFSSLWFPSFKVHTRVFLMNFNFFIIENEAGRS